jgi:hypothetical protein
MACVPYQMGVVGSDGESVSVTALSPAHEVVVKTVRLGGAPSLPALLHFP